MSKEQPKKDISLLIYVSNFLNSLICLNLRIPVFPVAIINSYGTKVSVAKNTINNYIINKYY